MRTLLLLLLLAAAPIALLAQPNQPTTDSITTRQNPPAPDPSFALFAHIQDSLFVQAYNQKNVPRYLQLMTEFNTRFNQLSPVDKKNYINYSSSAWYNLACTYGLLHRNTEALDALEKAVAAGYNNYSHTLVDTDLKDIRDSQRFRQIVMPMKETGDYMYILGKAAVYNSQDQRPLPKFTYEPASDSSLIALRKGLQLDSIAGGGSDLSQVLRLLHWIHDLVPHDGQHMNPTVMNAMSMIAVCRSDHRGLNCRGLAITLNECYLALGFRSRFVTCLPKDSLHTDPDCHVINIVYVNSLKKWVWIDPTNDAYVMNEKGELLNIAEVRQRLILHQPLIVNPDANWNHKSSVVKEDYLYNYMAKNLYMLECPVTSGYDFETRGPNKSFAYIKLLPLDYFNQGHDKEESDRPLNSKYINYHTNNAAKFWEKPQ